MDDVEVTTFNYILNFEKSTPFPPGLLEDIIQDKGYSVNEEISVERSPFAVLAEGEDFHIIYDNDDGRVTIYVHDIELEKAKDLLTEWKDIVYSDLDLDRSDLFGVQLQSRQQIWKGEDTTYVFDGFYDRIDLTEALGEHGIPYGVRLLSERDVSESNDYFDVNIEPLVKNTDYYYLQFVVSTPDFDEMIDYITDYPQLLGEIIEEIESHA